VDGNADGNPSHFVGVRDRSPMPPKRPELGKPVIHGRPRTPHLNLGVKWSQVQTVSARRVSARRGSQSFLLSDFRIRRNQRLARVADSSFRSWAVAARVCCRAHPQARTPLSPNLLELCAMGRLGHRAM
jgi:hypothetical protein